MPVTRSDVEFPSAGVSCAAWLFRPEACKLIVEGSEAIGRWEQDHSLPIDPSDVRLQVTMAAMAPI